MNRRHLLIATPALLLAGCVTGNTALATVAQDVATIASGLLGVLPNLPANIIPSATMAAVGAAVADLQSLASQVSSAASTTAAQPIVKQVETDVNTIVNALAAFPIPAPFSTAIQAAAVLLPIIEVAVGFVVPASAVRGAMTPDQARAALKAVAR